MPAGAIVREVASTESHKHVRKLGNLRLQQQEIISILVTKPDFCGLSIAELKQIDNTFRGGTTRKSSAQAVLRSGLE
ncbi:Uu.00g022290.m01.CDS01 [Anthostomella pinea]|uniref:Uu.00g022290.m01.CDS01 n=1 Tax=Anthostomella pinea TaxID=933095 RepID=A0AAI8W0C7_9PEZI|nr:Uu.00g022290.m01.CDS01 [Anthostomella pinea]